MEEGSAELAGTGWAGGAVGAGGADSSGLVGCAVEEGTVSELSVLSGPGRYRDDGVAEVVAWDTVVLLLRELLLDLIEISAEALAMENGLRDVTEDAGFFGREAALEHGAKHLGHHVLYVLRRGEVCRGALQGVGQFFRGAGRRGRNVVLTEGILRGETQVTAGAAIAGDMLAARTGRVQGSGGVRGGFDGWFVRDFHFGTPVEGAIGNFGGPPPPGVFRYELGKRQKRKEMGERVYGKCANAPQRSVRV